MVPELQCVAAGRAGELAVNGGCMAILIPSLGFARFDTRGELRLAERLKDFLEENAVVWHNLPVGPRSRHPDFIIVHPANGRLAPGVNRVSRQDQRRTADEPRQRAGEQSPGAGSQVYVRGRAHVGAGWVTTVFSRSSLYLSIPSFVLFLV